MSLRGVLACIAVASMVLSVPAMAWGHGDPNDDYETTVIRVEPNGLPIDVSVEDGDEVRFENRGDKELVVCGYVQECEHYVRIGPDGVFVNTNSKAYYANLDEEKYGDIPDDAGVGEPEWERVRREPPFFSYHDHRAHWMGTRLPPNVDSSDPKRQLVNEADIAFLYGDIEGAVTIELAYVGGSTWFGRWGEYLIVAAGIVAMVIVFIVDLRRRRRARGTSTGSEAVNS